MAGKNKGAKDDDEQNRKLDEILKKLTELEEQMTEVRNDNRSLGAQIHELKNENKTLVATLKEIKADNTKLIQRIQTIEGRANENRNEITTMKKRLDKAENSMDDFEQYSKLDNLIISGMNVLRPFSAATKPNQEHIGTDEEGKESWPIRDKTIMIDNFVKFANDKLGVKVMPSAIVDIHTLTKRSNEKETCIVRFSNRIIREEIIRNRRKLKSTNIYINEHLTQKNAALAKTARNLRSQGKIKNTWTKNCKIFIRKLDDSVFKLLSEDDFKHV